MQLRLWLYKKQTRKFLGFLNQDDKNRFLGYGGYMVRKSGDNIDVKNLEKSQFYSPEKVRER